MPSSVEKRAEYMRNRNRERIDLLAKMKAQPCADCGGEFPPECMDYDHVRGAKRANISRLTTAALSVLKAEIAKCDLVCANCHRIRTKSRGPRVRSI